MNFLLLTLGLLSPFTNAQDKTEIQWAICDTNIQQLIKKSALDFSPAESFRQSFYDTSETHYHQRGVSFHQKKNAEENATKVKITFAPGQKIDRTWLEENGGSCEYDSYGAINLLRCEMENDDAEELWSEEQREFLRRHNQADLISRFETWGPYLVKNWEVKTKEWGKLKLNDLSLGKNHIVELSVKSTPARAESLRKSIEQWMHEKNIQLCSEQVGKFQRILNATSK